MNKPEEIQIDPQPDCAECSNDEGLNVAPHNNGQFLCDECADRADRDYAEMLGETEETHLSS